MDRRKFLKIAGYSIPLLIISPKIVLKGIESVINAPEKEIIRKGNMIDLGVNSNARIERWAKELHKKYMEDSYFFKGLSWEGNESIIECKN